MIIPNNRSPICFAGELCTSGYVFEKIICALQHNPRGGFATHALYSDMRAT